jgi:transglutaminase-like putative cysteine protease
MQNPDGSLDLVAMEADPYIRAGEVYEVTASLPSFTQQELREAGTDYPEWVLERYLQLPAEITPRTIELARRLAEGKDNPYDIAQAITDFLRENIEYVEYLDELPPEDQDVVDWFLFEYQKGFCNYYATSEVLMLRSLGIPARWAVGYAQGERTEVGDSQTAPGPQGEIFETGDEIVVFYARQRDAHAWPEVYFPNIGWVEFEPTASIDPIIRPSGAPLEPVLPDGQPDIPDPNDIRRLRNQPKLDDDLDPLSGLTDPNLGQNPGISPLSVAFALIGSAFALGLLGFALLARQKRLPIWINFERFVRGETTPLPVRLESGLRRFGLRSPTFLKNWARVAVLPVLSKAYLEIDRALQRLGFPLEPSLTPAERAAALEKILPQASAPIDRLLVEYQLATYSPYQANDTEARQASSEIRRLSWLALLQKWVARFQEEPRNRFRT